MHSFFPFEILTRRQIQWGVVEIFPLSCKMGQKNSKNTEAGAGSNDINSPPEVTFDDFEVLRAIGRGAFGKVIHNCVAISNTSIM